MLAHQLLQSDTLSQPTNFGQVCSACAEIRETTGFGPRRERRSRAEVAGVTMLNALHLQPQHFPSFYRPLRQINFSHIFCSRLLAVRDKVLIENRDENPGFRQRKPNSPAAQRAACTTHAHLHHDLSRGFPLPAWKTGGKIKRKPLENEKKNPHVYVVS